MMRYVSIDIETTGLDPERCQILEIGAVIDDLADPKPLEELPRWVCTIGHQEIQGEPYALAMNAAILTRIFLMESPGVFLHPNSVAKEFRAWLREHGYILHDTTGQVSIVAAGKNFAAFDRRFLNRLPNWRQKIRVHHRCLDPVTLYTRPNDDVPPDTAECLRRAGIDAPVTHNALDDALLVVRLLRAKLCRENTVEPTS
jgi:DNA polymerase III epsilon subunit-like protein